MERLTEQCWGNLDPWEMCGQDHFCTRGCHDLGGCTDGCIVPKLYARLGKYEDTGLTPEQARELAQAEKDGRLVVLPCGTGDVVYHITTCENFPKILDGTMYDADGGPGTATGRYCPFELAEKCPFDSEDFDCNKNKKKLAAFEDEVVSFYIDDSETSITLGYSGPVSDLDFGKTVFLTREEAEAALKKMEADDEAI